MSDPLPGSHLALPEDDPSPAESVLKVVQRMVLKSFAWVGIYLLGYYNFSLAWLVTPLFLTALRSQWKKVGGNLISIINIYVHDLCTVLYLIVRTETTY